MRPLGALLAACALLAAAPAVAGPPYETDDPEPTGLHEWEIYGFVTADGRGSDIDGAAGFDLNYGPIKDVQLTATVPMAFAQADGEGWRIGAGDLELGVKYRFIDDARSGIAAAVFPRIIVPTARHGLGGTRTRLLLPLWLQKDFGSTVVFGGGGYEINPGRGNRDFWQAGLALTHDLTDETSLGTEVAYQSADTIDGASATGVNIGLIHKLGGPFSLLLAGGPAFSGGRTSYHGYVALEFND